MDELADLFELMHGAPESFRTLRAVIRDRSDYEPSRRAWADRLEEADPEEWAAYVAEGGSAGQGSCWCDCDYVTKLWIERPDRLREETEMYGGRLEIRRGGQCWSPEGTACGVPGTVSCSVYGDLFDPLPLVPVVHLEVVEEVALAGRAGIRLRALPRELDDLAASFSWLSHARSDEGELVVDRERGIVLRKATMLDGEPVEVVELTELELDAPLDPELFEPVLVDEPACVAPGRKHLGQLTVEQAAAHVPFTVFVFPAIWPRANLHVTLLGEMVWLTYSDFDGVREGSAARQVSVRQQGRPHETSMPERTARIDLDGAEALAWVGAAGLADGKVSFPRHLRFARGGTHLELEARGVGREELLALARSLVPARTETPRLG